MRRRVAIVGAGLAGLACARELARNGTEVVLVDRRPRVGGRIATDTLDGFRLDRGFQVLLTAYPEVRRMLDLDELVLGAFRRGALISSRGRIRRVEDPLGSLTGGPATLASGAGNPLDVFRTARLRGRLKRAEPAELLRRPETTTEAALADLGFSNRARDRFLAPFLGGVFSDTSLATSSRLMDVYLRSFAAGATTLPAGGMDAIPRQLASALAPGSVRLGELVVRVDRDAVELYSGEAIQADAVVLATDGRSATELDPSVGLEPWNPVACAYFDAPAPPVTGPWLVLDGDGTGPVNHLCVPSEVAPGYAPPGRALVSVSAVNPCEPDDEQLVAGMMNQLEGWFGAEIWGWRHLRTYRIEHAVPFRPPGTLVPGGRPARLASGVFCCGDHRDTPSIQGALYSGRRVARAVLRELGAHRLAEVAR